MSYQVRYSETARSDLKRHYALLLSRDFDAAERALETIIKSVGSLADFPFAARKAPGENPFIRELVIPFGSSGYVALFEVRDASTVNILAVRHQREDDYH